jgi:predicted transcriptional regulator
MKELTKAQEEVLKVIWKIEEGAVSDVLKALPEQKPAYTTVATVINVLEKKGYVMHKKFGKTKVFYPLVSKKEYARFILKDTAKGYFNGSFNKMAQFFVGKELSLSELEELRMILEKEINEKK